MKNSVLPLLEWLQMALKFYIQPFNVKTGASNHVRKIQAGYSIHGRPDYVMGEWNT